jgi:hypothetical protein
MANQVHCIAEKGYFYEKFNVGQYIGKSKIKGRTV